MPSIADKRKTFRTLHETGCFVIPNPWDVGSARYLQHLGFKAIASTSAGFAFAQGRPDGAIPCDMMLAHLHELAHASDLPLNADFEAGYADDLAGVAESVRLAVETGISGVSIEDGANRKLYSIDDAVARLRAARGAVVLLPVLIQPRVAAALGQRDFRVLTTSGYRAGVPGETLDPAQVVTMHGLTKWVDARALPARAQ